MAKVAVLVNSWGGPTRKVAVAIAGELGASVGDINKPLPDAGMCFGTSLAWPDLIPRDILSRIPWIILARPVIFVVITGVLHAGCTGHDELAYGIGRQLT
jgi:hypothetical protein